MKIKILKIILVFAIILPFNFIKAEVENFKIENGKVFYNAGHEDYKLIVDADVKSFKVIDFIYAKDKNYVFFQWRIIKGADSVSFIKLDNFNDGKSNFYAKDKKIFILRKK